MGAGSRVRVSGTNGVVIRHWCVAHFDFGGVGVPGRELKEV
jgi:hypothetical protein